MNEGIDIYGSARIAKERDDKAEMTLGKKSVVFQNNDTSERKTSGKIRNKDIRDIIERSLSGSVIKDAEGIEIEIDKLELHHLAFDFLSKVRLDEGDARRLFDKLARNFGNMRPFDEKADKDYDESSDTFSKTHSTRRKLFEKFLYYKLPIDASSYMLIQVGVTSERDGSGKRILDDNGNKVHRYYMHALKRVKEKEPFTDSHSTMQV